MSIANPLTFLNRQTIFATVHVKRPQLRAASAGLVYVMLVAGVLCWPLSLRAQVSQASFSNDTQTTTEFRDLAGATNPTRVTDSRTHRGASLVETRITEARSVNGGYAPISVVERETTQVSSTTVRVAERVFRIDSDGKRVLTWLMEEEKTNQGSGDENVIRTVSNPDVNGGLQVTQRDVESIHATRSGRETKTTIMLLGPNGLTPQIVKHEKTEHTSGATHSTATVSRSDGNGNFKALQTTDTVESEANGLRKTEESISQDNGMGMKLVQRSVTTETDTPTQTGRRVELYRYELPGAAADSQLHLVKREETTRAMLPDGSTETEQRQEEIVPGSAANDLRLTKRTMEISRTDSTGRPNSVTTIEVGDKDRGRQSIWIVESK